MLKPRITYMFDYGCFPLWLVDEEVGDEFGYNIDVDECAKLGLSESTIQLINLNCAYYETKLNPVYQGYPSFWSGRMHTFFQLNSRFLLEKIVSDIGDKFLVKNHITNELSTRIDIEQVDALVAEFVHDPVHYSNMNDVTFQSEGNLRIEIAEAYVVWVEKEVKILSKYKMSETN